MSTTSPGLIVYFDATRVRREKMRHKAIDPPVEQIIEESSPVQETAPEPVAAPEPTGPSQEELQSYLVNFVMEQTGYPEDFITLDADLEGDLGIDSIKKAQLLGELNEMFHFSDRTSDQDSGMSLDDFTSLRDISDFISTRLGGQVGSSPAQKPTVQAIAEPVAIESMTAPEPTGPSQEELQSYLVNFVMEQTGYPEDFITLDADLEGDLGIDSIKKAQLLGELNEMFHFSDRTSDQDSGMSLDDFASLRDISDFISTRLGEKANTGSKQMPAIQSETQEKFGFLRDFLINFVVEQTGYPLGFITLEADLESELGIDSIKKAQLFGELIDIVDVVPIETLSLDDFKTLGDIYHHIVTKSVDDPG